MKYRYNGRLFDVFYNLFGFVAYIDNGLEPHVISEAEFVEVTTKGEAV